MQNYGEVGTSIDTFFDSFTEFIAMCDDAPIGADDIGVELFDQPAKRRPAAASRRPKEDEHNAKWSGAEDWDDTLDIALRRWDRGREFMQNHKRLIEHDLSGITFKKEYRYDVTGSGIIDMPRHIMGIPDPFLVDHENDIPVNEKGSNIVRILYNGTTTATSTPQQMMIKGASVTSLIELLEMNNRRVEVFVGFCLGGYAARAQGKQIQNYWGQQGDVFHTIMIPVKTPGQGLVLDQVFFALGCPAMQRRLIFSFQERYIQPVRTIFNYDSHYGMVTDFKKSTLADDWDIIIPATAHMSNLTQWKAWILEEIKKQGIEVVE